jgi:hypothetical protein
MEFRNGKSLEQDFTARVVVNLESKAACAPQFELMQVFAVGHVAMCFRSPIWTWTALLTLVVASKGQRAHISSSQRMIVDSMRDPIVVHRRSFCCNNDHTGPKRTVVRTAARSKAIPLLV